MPLTLEQAIARVPQWRGARDLTTTSLGGGITNKNYRVDVGGESFVLRIGGENTELLGIDRAHERAASETAARLGIGPEVVYFVEPEGYLVTRFITGRPLPREEMRQSENVQRVAAALKRFHAVPNIPGAFSPFRTVEDYVATARRYNVAFPADFDWLQERVRAIEVAFQRDPFTPRPCHNDLLNENFIDDGAIRILDWEYAGMGDVAFDLANFAVHHEFGDDQDRLLLESYYGPTAESRYARHKLSKIVSDCREAMWALVQIGISKLDFDFRAYADKHFSRMAQMLRDENVAKWLARY
ncbi:MAG: phosphotransferase family protein [Chloroflexi bacterium]|nr:phosphotransferase family protein [Chloroflexota bacterium]